MSVVLVGAMKDVVVFMSDGRVSDTDENGNFSIIQEDYKKLIRVNDNLCIGYTGNKDICENILEVLNIASDKSKITLEGAFNTLYEFANQIYKKYNLENINFSLAIGGISSSRNIEVYAFNSKNNFKIKHHKPQNNDNVDYMILCQHESNEEKIFEKHLMQHRPLRGQREIKKAMRYCINEIATIDKTVNMKKFIEVIEK